MKINLVNSFTISPNLSITARQNFYISHIDHGLGKAVKEIGLTISKPVDNGNSVGSAGREQLLIRLEKPLLVLKVCEVVFVEAIGSSRIKVGQCTSVTAVGTCLL